MTLAGPDSVSKQLEFLRTIVPGLSRVAFLMEPDIPGHAALFERLHEDAKRLGMEVVPIQARAPEDLDRAFAAMAQGRSGAVIVGPSPFLALQRRKISALALKNSLPSTFQSFLLGVDEGGLLSYGPDLNAPWRQAAVYVDKIFKGANPGDLPIEQPTIFNLTLNIKTAKSLGLVIPQSLLIRADRVIE